jgi:hypothetical protein
VRLGRCMWSRPNPDARGVVPPPPPPPPRPRAGDGGVTNPKAAALLARLQADVFDPLANALRAAEERALAAEARVRDLEETVGELVGLVDRAPMDGREAGEALLDDVCDLGWS